MVTRFEDRRSRRRSPLAAPSAAERRAARYVLAGLRIVVGWTFLWAFLDKLVGFGYATPSERSWWHGGSPTRGFLAASATGPFRDPYRDVAGAGWADWLFMLGLLGIGVALLLGNGMRVAAASAALIYVLMWSVVLPPANNPVIDDHIVGALVVVGLALLHAGDTWGLGRRCRTLPVVRRHGWLV